MGNTGRFVWFDLMTTDTAAAQAFYTETLGWKASPWDGNGMEYTMLKAGERPIGGIMALSEELKAMKVPSHWTGSILVDDVDAIVARTTELGGTVHKAAWDIPEIGRLAVLADPQGGVFSVYNPLSEMSLPEKNEAPGEMGWHELNTTDYEAAWTFYEGLLGWKATDSMDMGDDMGTYFMFQRDGAEGSMGGMSNVAKQMSVPAHWLFYTNVDACGAAVERITSKGGKVVNGPMEVPGDGWIAQCQDPQGGLFAIYSSTK